jgi:hypothetical protein
MNAGNPFAPTPKFREEFSAQDFETTGRLLGLKVVQPKVFPINSIFVSPPTMAQPQATDLENRLFVLPPGLKIITPRTSLMLPS